MKHNFSQKKSQDSVFLRTGLAATLSFVLTLGAQAAPVRLATEPLANATVGTEVLPNLLVVFDDSGSMGWRRLPDTVSDYNLGVLGGSAARNRNAAHNQIYYDPAIRYDPPAYFDTSGVREYTTYQSMDGTSTAKGASTSAKPNWESVPNDAYRAAQGTRVLDAYSNSYGLAPDRAVYVTEPGEYCKDIALKNCSRQNAPDTTYKYPAPLRWCNTSGNASALNPAVNACQAVYVSGSFGNRRMADPRTSTIRITGVNNTSSCITSITVNGKNIMQGTACSPGNNTANNRRELARRVVDQINACNGIAQGNCQTSGYAAWRDDNDPPYITITAGRDIPSGVTTPTVNVSGTVNRTVTNFAAAGNVPGKNHLRIITPGTTPLYPYPGIYPGAGSVAKAPDRTDCAHALYCTGNEEMTNFANWYAYYGLRTSSMKTSMSLAFADIQPKYRIGIARQTFSGTPDLPVGKFEGEQKHNFYNKLFGMPANSNTPTRRAHATAGKYFAKKYSGADPMQFYCQANYVFLATDGYWNDAAGSQLNGSAFNPPHLWKSAEYYYNVDLRTPGQNNCTGAVSEEDVCQGKQRMGTFGMALGIPGQLVYQPNYKTADFGDYYDIKQGNKQWPVPKDTGGEAKTIDDLWRATDVSGGEYFSAKNPKDVISSLKSALLAMDKKHGSGSAAASSSLQPSSGDNYNYVASYTTVQWTGNLEARIINLDTVTNTGATSESAAWCVEDVAADSCPAPSTIVPIVTAWGTTYVCRPQSGNDVEISVTCTGKLKQKVSDFSDTRSIYMRSATNTLTPFSLANITARGLDANYSNTFLRNNLGQRVAMSSDQLNALDGGKLVSFLRGQKGYEKISGNTEVNQLFRERASVLGDIVDSQPNFRSKPKMNYKDAGYDNYKEAKKTTPGTVYVGANDGMLHAFDGKTGEELWAYIPSPVIPNLWRLADEDYPASHRYFVNGSPVVSDVCVSGCDAAATAVWKTILVSGLNAGGRGYFALDVTNPANPSLMWEFTAENDADLGFTYGYPVITKLDDGRWVVLVTSGYNNGSLSGALVGTTEVANNPAGNGRGYLYVLNVANGAKIRKISTGVGNADTPSGLSKISAWADDEIVNNKAGYVYGGDLLGNLWRFNINDGTVLRLTTLVDDTNKAQPITARPSLGQASGKRMVFVGTGKYLEVADLSTSAQQSIYGIMDIDATVPLSPLRSSLVKQVVVNDGDKRTFSEKNPVDYQTKHGWYVDFPDKGERQVINLTLEAGLLVVPSLVPESSVCEPGGYGWLTWLNYRTGVQEGDAGERYNSPIVGTNIFYINGKPVFSIVKANDPTPRVVSGVPFGSEGSGFSKRRAIWRELVR